MARLRGSFSSQITQWAKNASADSDLLLRNVAIEGFSILLRRSPVLTGAFRGNWQVSVNNGHIAAADKELRSSAPNGAPAQSEELLRALAVLAKAKFGDTIHITEDLPYAIKLERGYSRKAPSGVLRLSFLELKERLTLLRQASKFSKAA